MKPEHRKGILLIAAGATAMSFAPVFVRLADVPPTTSAFYRLAIGGFVLAAISFRTVRFDLGIRLWGALVLAGVVFALDLAFWHRSIHYIGPGSATILGNLQVFFVAIFGWIVLRERLGPMYVVGILIALTGLVLLVGDGWGRPGGNFRWGVVFGLLTAVTYAVYLVILRYSQSIPGKADVLPTMASISLVGAVVLAIAVIAERQSFAVPSSVDGVLLVAYAVTGQVVAWVLVAKGLPLLPVSRASLILLIQPSLAFLWDVLLLKRPTSEIELVGAALAIVGIYIGMKRGSVSTVAP